MTLKLDLESHERRRRVCTPEEQREFATLGRLLLENDVSLEEIQAALGYEGPEGVQRALDFARVTTDRLEHLRALAQKRLGSALPGANGDPSLKKPQPKVWTPPPKLGGTRAERGEAAAGAGAEAGASRAGPGAAQPEVLTKAQHRRLRDQIERLWAVDSRFRDWTLLAGVGGLASGQAMKREYEVGSSLATLRNVDTFCRLHAAFGSRATHALMEGVLVTELQSHLVDSPETETAPDDSGDPAEGDAAAQMSDASTEEGERAAPEAEEEPSTARGARSGRRAASRTRARGRKKVHLTQAQHRRLRETVEALWERDPKLRNWTLLARAGGLSTGPAMKRAYEVNSSVTTLGNLTSFARTHELYGRAAVDALRSGVAVEGLEEHLQRKGAKVIGGGQQAAAGVAQAAAVKPAAGAAPAAGEAPQTGTRAPAGTFEAPPSVDFSRLLELGQSIDAEVQSLWRASRLFDQVASQPALPRMIRTNAALASERLRSVIELFAGGGARI